MTTTLRPTRLLEKEAMKNKYARYVKLMSQLDFERAKLAEELARIEELLFPKLQLPSGYNLMNPASNIWHAMIVRVRPQYLLNKNGHIKRFPTPEKATQYAMEHDNLKLFYDQQVPGWD